LHLLLDVLFFDKHSGGEFHSLPAFSDACAQKQCAQMLFDGARADVQLARDFFVTASIPAPADAALAGHGALS